MVKKSEVKSHLIEKKNSEHNQLWEWEETPEVRKALRSLNKASKQTLSVLKNNVENSHRKRKNT
jgi:hypothetical protein